MWFLDHVCNAKNQKILYDFIWSLCGFFFYLSYKPCDLCPLQVLPHDELMETKKSHRHSHRKKVLPEIYLTRLLSTKVTG